jgi:hypothetical protein
MKRLLIALGTVVLLLYVTFLGYMFVEKKKADVASSPLETAAPFSSSTERVFPGSTSDPDAAMNARRTKHNENDTLPLTHFEKYRLEKLDEIYRQAVLLPGVDDYRLLTQDVDFVVRVYKVDGSVEIEVLLTEEPYEETQEGAELTLARMFEMERDDLCAYPITIREAAGGPTEGAVKTERTLVCRQLQQ